MAQPQTARITCSQCDASYDSERELQEHMKTAHPRGDTQQEVQLPIGGAPGK
jgi:hypothetical protein